MGLVFAARATSQRFEGKRTIVYTGEYMSAARE